MKLVDSQFAVLHNELKTLPLLPWSIIKRLLWELDDEIYLDIEKIAERHSWHFKYFIDGFTHFKGYNIKVTDIFKNIRAVSANTEKMTGYTPEETIGNCSRFLEGSDTSEDAQFLINIAIDEGIPFHSRLLNYRKDGEPYGCETHAFPIFDGKDEVSHYIGFEQEYAV